MSECFSTGQIFSGRLGCGLVFAFRASILIDCYSLCDIVLENTADYAVRGSGLIYANQNEEGVIKNCYYGGTITNPSKNKNDGVYALLLSNIGSVVNCHWLLRNDSLAQSAVGDSYTDTVETYAYENIEEMYDLAQILNGDKGEVWISVENGVPQLKCFASRK